MRVLVFDRRGGSKFVTCDASDSVHVLKIQFGAAETEVVKFGEKVLDDGDLLEACGLKHGSEVKLVLNPEAKSSQSRTSNPKERAHTRPSRTSPPLPYEVHGVVSQSSSPNTPIRAERRKARMPSLHGGLGTMGDGQDWRKQLLLELFQMLDTEGEGVLQLDTVLEFRQAASTLADQGLFTDASHLDKLSEALLKRELDSEGVPEDEFLACFIQFLPGNRRSFEAAIEDYKKAAKRANSWRSAEKNTSSRSGSPKGSPQGKSPKSSEKSQSPPRVEQINDDEKRRSMLREVFDAFDEDGSGCIEAEELLLLGKTRVVLGFRQDWSEEQNRQMVKRMDTDGDGQIDADEFVKYFGAKMPRAMKEFEDKVSEYLITADYVRKERKRFQEEAHDKRHNDARLESELKSAEERERIDECRRQEERPRLEKQRLEKERNRVTDQAQAEKRAIEKEIEERRRDLHNLSQEFRRTKEELRVEVEREKKDAELEMEKQRKHFAEEMRQARLQWDREQREQGRKMKLQNDDILRTTEQQMREEIRQQLQEEFDSRQHERETAAKARHERSLQEDRDRQLAELARSRDSLARVEANFHNTDNDRKQLAAAAVRQARVIEDRVDTLVKRCTESRHVVNTGLAEQRRQDYDRSAAEPREATEAAARKVQRMLRMEEDAAMVGGRSASAPHIRPASPPHSRSLSPTNKMQRPASPITRLDASPVTSNSSNLSPQHQRRSLEDRILELQQALAVECDHAAELRHAKVILEEEESSCKTQLEEAASQREQEAAQCNTLHRLEQENARLSDEARAMRAELNELQWKNRGLVDAEATSRAAINDVRNAEAMLAEEKRKALHLVEKVEAFYEERANIVDLF